MGAKANRAYLALVKESNFGETPVDPAMQKFNYTAESMNYNVETATSESIRADRMLTDLILTGAGCEGGFNFEMQYGQSGATDQLLLAALWSAAWRGVSASTGATLDAENATVVAATKTFTLGTDKGQMLVGQKFKVSGTTSNNGVFTVVTADNATGVYTVSETCVNETFGSSAVIEGEMIRNGLTRHSFSIEKGLTDVGEYFKYSGMTVNELSLNIEAGSIVTGSYSFIGIDSEVAQTAYGDSYSDAPSNPIMSAAVNVRSVQIDGAPIASCLLQSIEIAIGNNLQGKTSVGGFGYCDVVDGEFSVESSINLYFADSDFYSKYTGNTALSISLELYDSLGNSYFITIPKGKLSEDVVNIGGKNTDVMDSATLVSIMDADTNCMLQIDRFAA